jgi:hypothetical protein
MKEFQRNGARWSKQGFHDEASKYRQKYFNSTAQEAHSILPGQAVREIFESTCLVNDGLLDNPGLLEK